MKRLFLALMVSLLIFVSPQPLYAQSSGLDVFFVGHSLINLDVPHFFDALVADAGFQGRSGVQFIPAAGLEDHWERHTEGPEHGGLDARRELASGSYEVLVMTEKFPLEGASQGIWGETRSQVNAQRFYDLAVGANADTQVYLYTLWNEFSDATPMADVLADWHREQQFWEIILADIQIAPGAKPLLMVPGNEAMIRLFEGLNAGEVAGLNSHLDVMAVWDSPTERGHLNDIGNYYIALVQFATIYGQDPSGLTHNVQNVSGMPSDRILPETARDLQALAWEVVSGHPRSGVSASSQPQPAPQPDPMPQPEPQPDPEPAPQPAPETESSQNGLADIDGHAYEEGIYALVADGIVQGYPDGRYRPEQTINRAEFTKIVVEAVVNQPSASPGSCFPDVPAAEWFQPYVCYAKEQGIIKGYPDGSFRPGQNISFVEAAKIIVEAFGYPVGEYGQWFTPHVSEIDDRQAIPTSIAGFSHLLRRGEMAEIIYRLRAGVRNKSSLIYEDLEAMN